MKAPIYEIFFSYQGEGLYTGMPQIFVRFAGCNLKCGYCDTAYSVKISKKAKYYDPEELADKIKKLKEKIIKKPAQSFQNFDFRLSTLSLTGGEPLLHAGFLKNFLPVLEKAGFSAYLETNGTLPENLKEVIQYCGIVSMDFKFPSECGKSFWEEHKEFLKIAKGRAFVKCVITDKTTKDEILQSARIIKSVSKNIPLILQPSLYKSRPALPAVYSFYNTASEFLADVRIMAQLHKIYEIR